MVNMVDKAIGSAGAWLLQNDYQNKRTDGMALSTPEWMVQIGPDFSDASTLSVGEDYTGYMELLKWEARASRDFRGLSVGHALSSASMKHTYVEIQIPVGSYMPTLEAMMYNAINIDTITFVRLGKVNDQGDEAPVMIQKIEFEGCQIVYFEQSGDILILSFSFMSKTNEFTSYTRDGAVGVTVSSTVNFTTGEVSSDG